MIRICTPYGWLFMLPESSCYSNPMPSVPGSHYRSKVTYARTREHARLYHTMLSLMTLLKATRILNAPVCSLQAPPNYARWIQQERPILMAISLSSLDTLSCLPRDRYNFACPWPPLRYVVCVVGAGRANVLPVRHTLHAIHNHQAVQGIAG